jgi:hypothetical protein
VPAMARSSCVQIVNHPSAVQTVETSTSTPAAVTNENRLPSGPSPVHRNVRGRPSARDRGRAKLAARGSAGHREPKRIHIG